MSADANKHGSDQLPVDGTCDCGHRYGDHRLPSPKDYPENIDYYCKIEGCSCGWDDESNKHLRGGAAG